MKLGMGTDILMIFLLHCMQMFGELGHALLGPLTLAVGPELQYGAKTCGPKPGANISMDPEICEISPQPNGGKAPNFCELHDQHHSHGTSRNESFCRWEYNGFGMDYQWLVGSSYTFFFVIAGALCTYGNKFEARLGFLQFANFGLTVSFFVSGFVSNFKQFLACRIILGVSVGCFGPLGAALIAEAFQREKRILAMGVFVFGSNVGLGLSFLPGAYYDIFGIGWRGEYIVIGILSFILWVVSLAAIKDKWIRRPGDAEDLRGNIELQSIKSTDCTDEDLDLNISVGKFTRAKIYFRSMCRTCISPAIVALAVGACIRQSAFYTFVYYAAIFLQTHYPQSYYGLGMSGICIVGGGLGIGLGYFVSNRVLTKLSVVARALLLAFIQTMFSWFAIGFLYLDPPYSYLSLFFGYIIGESWLNMVFAIVADSTPDKFAPVFNAMFMLTVNLVGGNLPALAIPLESSFGLRLAFIAFYPGAIVTSAVFFAICGLFLKRGEMRLSRSISNTE